MKRFLSNLGGFLAVIILVLSVPLGLYLRLDPYKDLDKYDNYSWEYNFQMLGDLSTKKLLRLDYTHDSFIFGSSRTGGLYACYLNYLMPGASFYQYANWSEKIGGIGAKLQLLEEENFPIKNAIVYLDVDYTFVGSGQIRADDHYRLTGTSAISYYIQHFLQFYIHLNNNKLKILLGKEPEKKFLSNWHSDLLTNDLNHTCSDSIWQQHYGDTVSHEQVLQIDSLVENGFFYPRSPNQQFAEDQISIDERKMLEHIRDIFHDHETNYYIVITPIYNQVRFSSSDKQMLEEIFGDRVYDFSGINAYTENEYNYRRDRKHFRPYVSYRILNEIVLGKEIPSPLLQGSMTKQSAEN